MTTSPGLPYCCCSFLVHSISILFSLAASLSLSNPKHSPFLFWHYLHSFFTSMPRVLLVRVKHSEDDWPWGRHFPLQRQETFSLRWRKREKVRALNWLCSLSCSLTPPTRDSFSQYLMPELCSTVVCWPNPWVWSPCLAWSFSKLMGMHGDVTQTLKMWHKLVNGYTLCSDAVQRKKGTDR